MAGHSGSESSCHEAKALPELTLPLRPAPCFVNSFPQIEIQAISNYVRSLIAAHLADVNARDEHTLKPWFTGKLDYSPPVVDLSEAGYTLIGDRIDMLNQCPVAAIVYQHGNHLINLFVWPVASRKLDLDVQSDRGYRFCGWNKVGLNYLCISEGSAIALEEFEDEVREHTHL
jgi:anti-sigma factor RsiW